MRAVMVVHVDALIEPFLLLEEVLPGGAGRLFLQHKVHPFVLPILLVGAFVLLELPLPAASVSWPGVAP